MAHEDKDEVAFNNIKASLITLKPQYLNMHPDFFKEHMNEYYIKTKNLIDETIKSINYEDLLYIGLSVNLYQWVFSSIIAKKIKELNPDIPIVIGGIGTKDAAKAYLTNFDQFDIALWGEGENALLLLTKSIEKSSDYNTIPNMAYRKNDIIITTGIHNNNYISMSSLKIRPDYSDYFNQINIDPQTIGIPIEGGRGCHWGKCHFCYLNTGYRFRVKPPEIIVEEMEYMIKPIIFLTFIFWITM